ncbi:MAG: hypothetical protein H7Y20_18315 [Bryobacteraceae bacterium]|nr:hypothetical protein [Bryobacteraceae bacterium]
MKMWRLPALGSFLLTAFALADDRQTAQRLLDVVPEMASGVHAETAVVALWRAGLYVGTDLRCARN